MTRLHSAAQAPRGRLGTAEAAIAEIAAGRPVVVGGCERGDGGIVFAAAHATTALMAFAIRYTSGFLCVALPRQRCDLLGLPPMRHRPHGETGAAYCVTVDAAAGVSTGISAADRAATARLLADQRAAPSDFVRPGHVVPLATGEDGVLGTPGLPEAAVDLAWLAGQQPAGVLGHVVSPTDPTRMANEDELALFSEYHGMTMIQVADVVALRRAVVEWHSAA